MSKQIFIQNTTGTITVPLNRVQGFELVLDQQQDEHAGSFVVLRRVQLMAHTFSGKSLVVAETPWGKEPTEEQLKQLRESANAFINKVCAAHKMDSWATVVLGGPEEAEEAEEEIEQEAGDE